MQAARNPCLCLGGCFSFPGLCGGCQIHRVLGKMLCPQLWSSVRTGVSLGLSDLCGVKLPLWSCDLGHFRYLRVELLLGVLRVGTKAVPQVWSRCSFRTDGIHATGKAGVPVSLDPWGLSYSWCWGHSCDPGSVRAPGIWAYSGYCGTRSAPKNYSWHGLLQIFLI